MKTKMSPLLIVMLIAAMWMIPGQTQALLFIPDDFRSGITLSESPVDDLDDTDQGFPTSDRDVIVQINNEYRRYLGVIIDRSIQGQTSISVDNGNNDRMIGPGSKLASVATLSEWARCIKNWDSSVCTFTAPNSRRYVLPVPIDAAPGSEVKFRIRAVGPAIKISFPDVDPELRLLQLEALGWTLWDVALLDLLKMYFGGVLPDASVTQAVVVELINYIKLDTAILNAFEKGDYTGVLVGLANFVSRSQILKAWAEQKGLEGSTKIATSVDALQGLLGKVTIVELMNAFSQLVWVKWQETYEVVVVIPKINDIQPAVGKAGDLVTIHGVGFDPYHKDNNSVFFTGLNPQGVPWLKLKAKVVEVSAEDTMTVEVPADFESGPVMVCTEKYSSAYCSNTDVVFNNPLPSGLSIISPENNAKVSGSISVAAVVPSPPVPFPASVGRLLVDGTLKFEKAVTTPDFSFVLDTGTLTAAVHTLTVELITAGQTLSASVQIDSAPSSTLSITSPAAGANVFGVINISAQVLNPPNPFPTDQATQATLFLDGQQVDQKSVTSATFGFSLNTGSLTVGNHSLQINLILLGVEHTASITVTVSWYPSQDPAYGVNTDVIRRGRRGVG